MLTLHARADPALGVAVGWNHFVSLRKGNTLLFVQFQSHITDKRTREQFAQTSYVIFEATIINTLVAYWGYDESPAILITG
jgi:amino acid transporter